MGIKGNGINDCFPSIGQGCVLSAGAKLFGNITIGRSCIVGANDVVTSDMEG